MEVRGSAGEIRHESGIDDHKGGERGRHCHGSPIDVVSTFQDFDTLIMDPPDSYDRALLLQLVADNRHFKSFFNTCNLPRLDSLVSSGRCQSFLKAMKMLERLQCFNISVLKDGNS